MKTSALAISALLGTFSAKSTLFEVPPALNFHADVELSDPFVNNDVTGTDDRFKTIKQLSNQNGFRTEEV